MGILPPVEERKKILWAYVAAAALTILTLYVFFRLQDYGPESAVRRFHADVLKDDATDLQRVTQEPIGTADAENLIGLVHQFLSEGASYQILSMERTPEQVRAGVVYSSPDGEKRPMLWVVEKTGRSWRVNTRKTMTIIRALGGRYPTAGRRSSRREPSSSGWG